MAGRLIGRTIERVERITCAILLGVLTTSAPHYGTSPMPSLDHLSPPLRNLATPLSEIRPDQANARRHGQKNLAAIQASLQEFGQQKPIVVDADGVILAGNGTYDAAVALGWEQIAAVRSKLRGSAARAYAIADNRTTDLSEWDDLALAQTLAALREDDAIDQTATGFSDLEIELMLAELDAAGPAGDPDDAPEVPAAELVRSRPGDLWRLGEHRLLVGDSTCPADVGRVVEAGTADLVFTDPPYNMNYKSQALGGIKNDHLDQGAFVRLILGSVERMRAALRPGGSFYICMSPAEYGTVAMQLKRLGLKHQVLVWRKPSAGMGSQEFRPAFELMLYGYTGTRKQRTWHGARRASNVWDFDLDTPVFARDGDDGEGMVLEFDHGSETVEVHLDQRSDGQVVAFDGETSDVWCVGRERGAYCHPTQKPVALVRRAISLSSDRGGVVVDLFTGSGTTMIAAHLEGRVFRGLELDPRYADVICQRWADFTGEQATRDGDDAVFCDVDTREMTA